MAAVLVTGGVLAGLTLEGAISMGAGVAGGTAALLTIVKELHELGHKPSDPIPASHLSRVQAAVGQIRGALIEGGAP